MAIIAPFKGRREIDRNRFSELVLLCYIAVFAVMPLAYIHVEPQNATLSFVEDARTSVERFLVVLHEALSLHFKDRADHACFARGGLPGKVTAAALSPDDGRQPAISAPSETLLCRLASTAAVTRGHRGDGAAAGVSLCRCGLSPPSRDPRAS